MEKLFYLQDSRSSVGSNVVFWNKGGCGYGTDLDKLETYTQEEAQRRHNSRNSDVPLLKFLVDTLSITAVDHQYLPESGTRDPENEYIVQINGRWNGNDICFVSLFDGSYNYNEAEIFAEHQIKTMAHSEYYSVFSKASLDKIARRTFQLSNIDKKAMIKDAGIKLVKPKRGRKTTGKTRGNCPTCGKITWDYDPHEHAYCVMCNPYLLGSK